MSSVNQNESRGGQHGPNFRELHQRVNSILQEISSTSTHSSQTTTPQGASSQRSSSSKDSLSISSVSPPNSPGSFNPSPRNSDLALNSSRFQNELPTPSYTDNMMNDRAPANPDALTLQLNRLRFGNDAITALSPITEGIPSKNHAASKGVSAAVSDESVAADSGVFVSSMENLGRHNSMRSSGHSDDDGIEVPQIKIGLGYVEEKEQLLVCIDEAYSLRLLGSCDGCGVRAKVRVLPPTNDVSVYSTAVCKDLRRPVFSDQFFVSLPKVSSNSVWFMSNELPFSVKEKCAKKIPDLR